MFEVIHIITSIWKSHTKVYKVEQEKGRVSSHKVTLWIAKLIGQISILENQEYCTSGIEFIFTEQNYSCQAICHAFSYIKKDHTKNES